MNSDKIPPPFVENVNDYDQWKKDLDLWTAYTSIKEEKQAIAVHLSLTGRARKATSEVPASDMKTKDGMSKLIEKLDRVFMQDANWKCFHTYLSFENYRRKKDCSIDEYLSEFDLRHYKLKECGVELPDAVIACRLLKSCGLNDLHFQLALSTTPKMTFEEMRNTLKKLFAENSHMVSSVTKSETNVDVVKSEPVENNDALYASHYRRGRGGSWSNNRDGRGAVKNKGMYNGYDYNANDKFNNNYKSKGRMNPLGRDGTVSLCAICGSKMHWAKNCPHSYERNYNGSVMYNTYDDNNDQEVQITLLTNDNNSDPKMDQLLGETIGSLILDSGCSRTVCGRKWLTLYLDTLDKVNCDKIKRENSSSVYRFGDGKKFVANECVTLPCVLAGKQIQIKTDVVDCNIPLLLSKKSMKTAGMVIDLKTDTATVFGQDVTLKCTSMGHYTLPIYFPLTPERIDYVLLASDVLDRRSVIKLHRQFAHPSSEKLQKLLKSAGKSDPRLMNLVDEVTTTCETCVKYKKPRHKPIVAMSMGSTFNETVAMDLKVWDNGIYFLVLVDIATRFCQAVVIRNKYAETITRELFSRWISLFGSPRQFLNDNGGEFNNSVMKTLADNFNIKLVCTAAESPWSNSVCERLNGVLAISVRKIMSDTKCCVEVALNWAVASRNALQNYNGFSPNQLVFGFNPALPNVYENNAPQLEAKSTSKVVADNINAMHSSRVDFLKNESSEKIRRALLHQVRSTDVDDLKNGDSVYYKRNSDEQWHGPGNVIGMDGKQVLVRHGGTYVRVHTCRLQHAVADKSSSELEACDKVVTNDIGDDSHEKLCDKDSKHDNFRLYNYDSEDEVHENHVQNSEQIINNSQQIVNNTETSDVQIPYVTPNRFSVKPKVGQKIQCWPKDDESFTAKVISRAGKAGGIYDSCYNIERNDGTVEWIDLARQVEKWRPFSENNEVLLNLESSSAVMKAKEAEIENWKNNDVYTEVENVGQSSISLRWVMTEKFIGNETKIKARLVARGFEEDLGEHRTDSPTCAKDSLRVALTIISSNRWQCNTIDIKSAFLQGENIERELYVRPPRDFDNGLLWKLKKTVYGLCDAARAWYFKVKSVLIEMGMTVSKLDPALFVYHKSLSLIGIVCIHVDDFCWAGTNVFKSQIIDRIHDEFIVGSSNRGAFKYIGVHIEKLEDGIGVHQYNYISNFTNLCELNIMNKNLRKRTDDLSDSEKKEFRAIVGQLNWICTQTRPDLSYDVCELSSRFNTAKVDDALRANKVIKKAIAKEVVLKYVSLENNEQFTIECYSDASYGNLPDGGSQGGYVVFITDYSGNKCPITWQSRKVRRVVRSTLAAETLALVDAAEAGIYIATLIVEILGKESERVPVKCYVDNKSLVDSIYSTKSVEDKQLRINIAVLRDLVSKGDIQSVSWVRSSAQLADVLTKRDANCCPLLTAITGGSATKK